MAYETYTTLAVVCGTFDRNTADRSYLMFTREAGMLYADARSARKEQSRQRYALQELSLLRVSLVKGKRGWKVGSIEPQKNYYHLAEDKLARGSVVSLFRLLRRFVRGEEAAPELFDYLIDALETLSKGLAERQFVEQVVKVKILSLLGYVDVNKVPQLLQQIAPADIQQAVDSSLQKEIDALYDQAVATSHL